MIPCVLEAGAELIPDFSQGNVLPPFTGGDVVGGFHPRSPYIATMTELVERFGSSPERAEILRGFKRYRDELKAIGFSDGFQWVDGSFVEACEVVKSRPPSDIDVVSVLERPQEVTSDDDWLNFVETYDLNLFDAGFCKGNFRCDSYFIDLGAPPLNVAQQAAYWFGLFSHQRDTFRWKGLVQIDLQCDDDAAMRALDQKVAEW